ncbi:MAG: radical SAM protein [Candidatus Methanomethylicota archaeon]|uniref:Radical SAM protein n=1 Tax=Thermoproteota archaeon TaxID=2056631 RepID=A0A497EQ31_9CREN|nr:MAG: radical SAM protein [Candidatus Verstraetearchaeota archaeon]
MQSIRVSYGTAVKLKLMKGLLQAEPTTAYLLLNNDARCDANCAFCPQARSSLTDISYLSRISWPSFKLKDVVDALKRACFARICIQLVNRKDVLRESFNVIKKLRESCGNIAISVSSPPIGEEYYLAWRELGVDMVGVSLDAANQKIFDKVKGFAVKGPYTWEGCWRALNETLEVFGKGKVSVHLIVGLGESEYDVCSVIQKVVDLGAVPSLFAFTPVKGTALEHMQRPHLDSYRRIQIARHLIAKRVVRVEDLIFNDEGRLIEIPLKDWWKALNSNDGVFTTCGCPGCNRPFYNEEPKGPIYNYPYLLSDEEFVKALRESLLVKMP